MLTTPMFELTGSLTYKQLSIEDAGQVIFDFVELEDNRGKQNKPSNMIKWLGSQSSSLKQTYFHAQVEKLKGALSEAHQDSKEWGSFMQGLSQKDYIKEFQKQRIQIFQQFVRNLKSANAKHLLNNFDMQNLSLPLEYSLENNFWCAQALHMQLNFFEKEEKFNQLL